MHPHKHVMIDLETLGTNPNSVILSIAAVRFDPDTGSTSDSFLINIDPQSCIDYGLQVSGDTFLWWMSQSESAREHIYKKPGENFEVALIKLYEFLEKDDIVWGNSARFDLGILHHAFTLTILEEAPWDFRNERCLRTLASFRPDIKDEVLQNSQRTAHFALDDCKNQIEYCTRIWKSLNI